MSFSPPGRRRTRASCSIRRPTNTRRGSRTRTRLVGKFMMTHHIAGTWALFDEDITPHMGTIAAQYMSYDRYAKTSYPNAFGSTFIVAGAAMKTSDFASARGDLFGPELAAFMRRAAKGITRITMFGEGLPHIENRVELATDQKDEFGMPLARLIHSFDDDAIALWSANFEQGIKVAKASGTKEVWPGKGPVVPTTHLHGGAIMGTSAANSVVNSYGQTHEVPNLWDGRTVHLPERRRVESDLHDFRGVAARRGKISRRTGRRWRRRRSTPSRCHGRARPRPSTPCLTGNADVDARTRPGMTWINECRSRALLRLDAGGAHDLRAAFGRLMRLQLRQQLHRGAAFDGLQILGAEFPVGDAGVDLGAVAIGVSRCRRAPETPSPVRTTRRAGPSCCPGPARNRTSGIPGSARSAAAILLHLLLLDEALGEERQRPAGMRENPADVGIFLRHAR